MNPDTSLVLLGLWALVPTVAAIVSIWSTIRRKPPIEAEFLSRTDHDRICGAMCARVSALELEYRTDLKKISDSLSHLAAAVARIEGRMSKS